MGTLDDHAERVSWYFAVSAASRLKTLWGAGKRYTPDARSREYQAAMINRMMFVIAEAQTWRGLLREKATLQKYVLPHMGSGPALSAIGGTRLRVPSSNCR